MKDSAIKKEEEKSMSSSFHRNNFLPRCPIKHFEESNKSEKESFFLSFTYRLPSGIQHYETDCWSSNVDFDTF